jgi:anti-anti-sigma factor
LWDPEGVGSSYTAAIGAPALPLPLVVHTPAEEASGKVSQLQDQREVPRPLILAVEQSDGISRLRLTGDFDVDGVGAVENALHRVFQAPPPRRVVFDLRGLAFLDMAGLLTFLRADARGRAEAIEVLFVRPRGTVNRIFTLTRAGGRLSLIDEPEVT